jgi:hypothetical protein
MVEQNDAPIIPGVGAAGVQLGDSEQVLAQKLGTPKDRVVLRSGVVRMAFGPIQVWLDPSLQVKQIRVTRGYEGKTSDGIHIGLPKAELKEKWGLDLAYHEENDYWEFMSRPGTLFEFALDQNGVERIQAIYVSQHA